MWQVVHTALFARGAPDTRARRGTQVWLPGEALENVRLRRLRQHVYGKFRFYEASARISSRDWENLEGAEKWRVCSENKRWYNRIRYNRGNSLLVIDSWWSCKRYNLTANRQFRKKLNKSLWFQSKFILLFFSSRFATHERNLRVVLHVSHACILLAISRQKYIFWDRNHKSSSLTIQSASWTFSSY